MADDRSSRRLLQFRQEADLKRDAEGAPLLSPFFVLHQGPDVHVVDVRPAEEAGGALGYIPGSVFCSVDRLEQLVREVPDDLPVVLVSRTGRDAAKAALQLQRSGRRYVAAMAGGLTGWRRLGFGTSRDPAGVLDVQDVMDRLRPTAAAGPMEGPFSVEQVRDHVGEPRNVRWVKLASMATYGHFSCIDGRDERGVIGAPGGDAGEFLLSLAAVERATGATLDEDDVAQALLARIDTFGDFSRHTDGHAFETLAAAVRDDARIGDAIGRTVTESYEYLRRPPAQDRPALLEHLLNPDYLGCGHVRLMLQHPDEYGIRRELVESFLRSFYHLWWQGAPELDLTLLPGEHAEAAVVNVRLEEELWGMSRVPLVSPTCAGSQMFINHPDVASYLRQRVVEFHVRGLGPVAVKDPEALRTGLEELASQQLTRTIGYLAKGLPIYDVVFSGDGSYEVRASGG